MKQKRTCPKRMAALLLSLVMVCSAALTGCSDEDPELWKDIFDFVLTDVLDEDSDFWTEDWEEESRTEGEEDPWWEHPVAGNRVDQDTWEEDNGFDWWNALNESWTREDWELMEDGVWMIFDEETACVYLYDEEYQSFGAVDPATEECYILDMDSGEWVPLD